MGYCYLLSYKLISLVIRVREKSAIIPPAESHLFPLPRHDLLHLALLLLDAAAPLLQLQSHAVQLGRDGVCNGRSGSGTMKKGKEVTLEK